MREADLEVRLEMPPGWAGVAHLAARVHGELKEGDHVVNCVVEMVEGNDEDILVTRRRGSNQFSSWPGLGFRLIPEDRLVIRPRRGNGSQPGVVVRSIVNQAGELSFSTS